jgi:hypothetical protein
VLLCLKVEIGQLLKHPASEKIRRWTKSEEEEGKKKKKIVSF